MVKNTLRNKDYFPDEMFAPFKIEADMVPTGDQPVAIDQLVHGLESQLPAQTLLGVSGSG